MQSKLKRKNIDTIIRKYEKSISKIGGDRLNLVGIPLFQYLKRSPINSGPYPHVTLFEAANRIMTDLVILKGVKWLLDNQRIFPFDEYDVEYGNKNDNAHDICAKSDTERLIGEAFNVAPSYFQTKKTDMLRKLRNNPRDSNYMVIIANSDSVKSEYRPQPKENEYYLFVDIESGEGRLFPNNQVR